VLFPNARGCRLTVHGVQHFLNKHRLSAANTCPSLKKKRVTVHRFRHTMAVDMLQEGVDRSTIALWLGHEHVQTTQVYLDATLAMKEKALKKVTPHSGMPSRYHPDDRLLAFLRNL
jgi:site-specific recombinase XerD